MKAVVSALALVSALIVSAPANAALTDYAFAGSLTNGTKFDGAFTFDDSKSGFTQFSNYYANVGGVKLDRLFAIGTDFTSYYMIGFTNNASYFGLALNSKSASAIKLEEFRLGPLNSKQTYLSKDGVTTFGSGTISLANSAAVPEPTTWALMILGFGAVGCSMRRRQKVAVRYA